jgi:hypothetical protein
LFIEELMKEVCGELQSIRKEMKDGFTTQENIFNTHITELSTMAQQREERVLVLEAVMADFDKMFNM